jgi:hypothetical protein
VSELEERARRVLEVARRGHGPSAADAVRVRAALRQRALVDPSAFEAAGLARGAGGKGILDKLLLTLGVGAVAGFAAGFYVAQSIAPTARVHDAVSPPDAMSEAAHGPATAQRAEPTLERREASAAADTVTDAGEEPARSDPSSRTRGSSRSHLASPRAGPSTPAPKASPRSSAAPSVSPLKAELDGLRRAQELLHQGQPAWALARLDELDRAHVGSALSEERAATRAIAECRLDPSAREPLASFARRYPGSAHLDRVRSSCSAPTRSGAAEQNLAPAPTETGASRHE